MYLTDHMEELQMKLNKSVALLSNRNFRHMFIAYTLASFGDWFDAIAIQVLVAYRWGVDPFMLALIPVAMALPAVLLGSFAGTVTDRVNKARLMIVCDLVTAGLTLAILFAPNMLLLIPLLALRAAASVFHGPAQQALTRQVVPTEQLFQATSLNGLVNQGSKVAGPLLGAITLVVMPAQACIILNIVARLLSALFLSRVSQTSENAVADVDGSSNMIENKKRTFFAEWREGWMFLLRSKIVLHTILFGFFGLISILMIDYQFPTLLREIDPTNESLIGWLISAIGAGAVTVLLVLNRWNCVSYGLGLGSGYVLIGTGVALLGLCPPGTGTILLLVFGFLLGMGNGFYMVTQNYILQKESPPEVIGRVFGIQNTISSLVMLTAPLAGGILIRSIQVGHAFMLIGITNAALGILAILFGRMLWPQPASRSEFGDQVVKDMQ